MGEGAPVAPYLTFLPKQPAKCYRPLKEVFNGVYGIVKAGHLGCGAQQSTVMADYPRRRLESKENRWNYYLHGSFQAAQLSRNPFVGKV